MDLEASPEKLSPLDKAVSLLTTMADAPRNHAAHRYAFLKRYREVNDGPRLMTGKEPELESKFKDVYGNLTKEQVDGIIKILRDKMSLRESNDEVKRMERIFAQDVVEKIEKYEENKKKKDVEQEENAQSPANAA